MLPALLVGRSYYAQDTPSTCSTDQIVGKSQMPAVIQTPGLDFPMFFLFLFSAKVPISM